MLTELESVNETESMRVISNGEGKVIRIDGEGGEGFMTVYILGEGIAVMYNDFHIRKCKSDYRPRSKKLLCFDHCREGRLEQRTEDFYYYFEKGDFRIDNRERHYGDFELPLAHYHGMTVVIDLEEAERTFSEELKTFQIDLQKIYRKYCDGQGGKPFIIRQNPKIEHIFSELYELPAEIKKPYQKLKIIELLLFLSALDFTGDKKDQPYFYRVYVEKVKAIYKLMTENLEKHYTLEWLAREYDISLTQMKNCFKEIYGAPIFSFMREYRINAAANLLKTTKRSVTEIALSVGYDNPSKFISAFKEIMKRTPLEYRKSIV